MEHQLTPRRRTAAALLACAALSASVSACGTRQSRAETIKGLGPAYAQQVPVAPAAPASAGAVQSGAADGAHPAPVGPTASASSRAVQPQTIGPAPASVGSTASARASSPTRAPSAPAGSGSGVGVAPASAAAATKDCAGTGTPIVIGQVGTFSGVLGPTLANSDTALKIWQQWVNAHGGVACHPVTVYSVDDGGDASKASAAIQDLVQNKKAIAIVGAMAPLTIQSLQSYAEAHKIPIVGGDDSSPNWVSSPMLFPAGTTEYGSVVGFARLAVKTAGPNVALFHCVESTICSNGAKLLIDDGVAKQNGANIVYNASTSITQPSFVSQCQAAQQAKAASIIVAMDGSSLGRVGRDCASLGYHPQLVAPLLALNDQLRTDPNVQGVVTAGGTVLWSDTSTAGAREMQAAFQQYAPSVPLTAFPAQAWATAQLFADALTLAAVPPAQTVTSADILRGLGKIKADTLGGLISPTTFSPGESAAPDNKCYFAVQVLHQNWAAPFGIGAQC